MGKILAISSALPFTEIALVEGNKTLYYRGWRADYNEAEKLLENLRAIKEHKLNKVVVVTGPGGFTGLRVGVTMANTIAYANNIKVHGIETTEFLQAKIPNHYKNNTIILSRMNLPGIKDLLAGKKQIKYATGDLTPEQVKLHLPKSIKWLELKDLKPLNEVIPCLPRGEKTVKPKYFAPPKITASKKKIFK